MPCLKAASRCAPAASDENNINPTRRMVPAGCPRPSVYAKNRPMPPASKMLRRVITVHLVDERTPAIVRLQRELSAGNERLLEADLGRSDTVCLIKSGLGHLITSPAETT